MRQAGCELLQDMTDLAVMGLGRVLTQLPTFAGLLSRVRSTLQTQRPDAVILIDYPGFNWWVARAAKRQGIPVFYYGVPQMWAWASWRIKKMQRLVDHVLCKLAFEAQWYQERGCRASYVGHPYFDELQQRPLDMALVNRLRQPNAPLITLLPGSRRQELASNLPVFQRAVMRIKAGASQTRFAVACINEKHAHMARAMLAGVPMPLEIHADRTAELIEAAHSCLACSGSVSLELVHHVTPAVIHYRVSRLKYQLIRRMIHVRYITLANLLAMPDRFQPQTGAYDHALPRDAEVPFPEYPTHEDKSETMARHILQWLNDPEHYDLQRQRIARLKDQVDRGGATQTAAQYILQQLAGNQRAAPQAA